MAIYAFETITAEQAANLRAEDVVTFARGPASRVSVVYQSVDPLALTPEVPSILVGFEGRIVKFSTVFSQLTKSGQVTFDDGSKLLAGDTSSEILTGSSLGDALYGGPGDDTLDGGRGDDLLQGNAGDDVLSGGGGSDTLYGGQGDDVINVGRYGDASGGWAHGNQGNDDVIGGAGDDVLYGGQGDDLVAGGDGDDVLFGDKGNDEIITGAGDDLASGGDGDDTITNMDGADALKGGDGDDMLVSYGFGHALLDGGAGNDTLVAASNNQMLLYGGEGRDRFEFAGKFGPTEGADHAIADWEASDTISFAQVSIYSILPRSYSEFVADDYAQAHAIADEHIQHTGAQYAVAQVGHDLYVFADTDGNAANGADIAVMLIGKTLDDISLQNFLGDMYIA